MPRILDNVEIIEKLEQLENEVKDLREQIRYLEKEKANKFDLTNDYDEWGNNLKFRIDD